MMHLAEEKSTKRSMELQKKADEALTKVQERLTQKRKEDTQLVKRLKKQEREVRSFSLLCLILFLLLTDL